MILYIYTIQNPYSHALQCCKGKRIQLSRLRTKLRRKILPSLNCHPVARPVKDIRLLDLGHTIRTKTSLKTLKQESLQRRLKDEHARLWCLGEFLFKYL